MQKKLSGLDEKMLSMFPDGEEKISDLPTRRAVLRMIANIKSDTADDSRRTLRIVNKLRDKNSSDLILESDDFAFLTKRFEANPVGLVAWMQGQVLEYLESVEKVEPVKA